jgi:hypothetical protein
MSNLPEEHGGNQMWNNDIVQALCSGVVYSSLLYSFSACANT